MSPIPYSTHFFSQSKSHQNLFEQVKEGLRPHLFSALKWWLPEGKITRDTYVALNPTRPDRHLGSFQINLKTGEWIDFATGDKGGDSVSLYAYLKGLTQLDAALELKRQFSLGAMETRTFQQPRVSPPQAPSELFLRLWNAAKAAEGTVVETYLRNRGYQGKLPVVLRYLPQAFHTPTQTTWPCMVGAVTCWPDQIIGLHRTFLKPDGSGKADITPSKMILGKAKGGGLFLRRAKETLLIAEGIETALSVAAAFPCSGVWAALSATGIPNLNLPPLPLAQRVIIAADPDQAGLQAAYQAASAWQAGGTSGSPFHLCPHGL